MSALVDRITAVQAAHERTGPPLRCVCGGREHYRCVCHAWEECECGAVMPYSAHAAHVAEQIAAELMSWDFLMALLNEHYPEDVFPTMEDRTDRDTGPRIVSLIRYLDATRRSAVEEKP